MFAAGRGYLTIIQRMIVFGVCLLSILVGCAAGAPSTADLLGSDVSEVTRAELKDGFAVLGRKDSGEFVVGVMRKGSTGRVVPLELEAGRPAVELVDGVALVGGLLPVSEAQRVEVLTENRLLLKAPVRNGAYLVAWPADSWPRLLLRALDAKGEEVFRWPPAGGLPAA